MDKNKKYLLILESPNKKQTVSDILKSLDYKNIKVAASVGHIIRIEDSGKFNMGIDPDKNFKIDYKVSPDKKEVVSKLKQLLSACDEVILATDPDREGEVISWSLKEFLKIPESKYKRITYNEITKSAIKKAFEEARAIDMNLVEAGQARSCADKIIGYRLSNIARNNVGARSVGRCQSAGLKLLVEREEEIQNFKPETFYDLLLHFSKNGSDFTAKYQGTTKQSIKNLKSVDECKKIINECKNGKYVISNISFKDSIENPKKPFITATYQQEVSKRLGISVKYATDCAQKLFEGISINGNHVALITYHRTDYEYISEDCQKSVKAYIEDNIGEQYYSPFKMGKKSEQSQAGHEAIRPVDINMTPQKLRNYISDERLLKIYDIIWRRTVACCMKPAIIANTIYDINNEDHMFSMTSKELKFDGYRKIYEFGSKDDNDDQIVKETFSIGEELQNTSLEAVEKTTKPPARFSEASFIKALQDKGIGRPSTFASILNVLMDEKRGYTKIEDKCIVPTDLGIKLSRFLDKNFSNVISIEYTAELEKELDKISEGRQTRQDFLTDFYKDLEDSIEKVSPQENMRNQKSGKKCPECGADLVIRKSRYGKFFLGCSNYPKCHHMENC